MTDNDKVFTGRFGPGTGEVHGVRNAQLATWADERDHWVSEALRGKGIGPVAGPAGYYHPLRRQPHMPSGRVTPYHWIPPISRVLPLGADLLASAVQDHRHAWKDANGVVGRA